MVRMLWKIYFFEIGLAITLFIGTNIDDVFVLLAFFSDKRIHIKEIVIGQYLRILALIIGSFALSFGAKKISQSYIGLLALFPLLLVLKKLWEVFKPFSSDEDDEEIGIGAFTKSAKIFSIAGVTMANGGDNLGVYVPLFATKTVEVLILYIGVFLVMTANCYLLN